MMNRFLWITVAVLLLLTLLFPLVGTSDSYEQRLQALETYVQTLEERVASLEEALAAGDSPDTADAADGSTAYALGDRIVLGEAQTIALTSFDFGTRFRYYPAGGFSALTLSAKDGYRLVSVTMRVENGAAKDFNASKLLNATIHYGTEYTGKPQDMLFYVDSNGRFSGGLKTVGPGTDADICMLFAVPQGADTSAERISVQFQFEEESVECVLRPGGSLLTPGETETF